MGEAVEGQCLTTMIRRFAAMDKLEGSAAISPSGVRFVFAYKRVVSGISHCSEAFCSRCKLEALVCCCIASCIAAKLGDYQRGVLDEECCPQLRLPKQRTCIVVCAHGTYLGPYAVYFRQSRSLHSCTCTSSPAPI